VSGAKTFITDQDSPLGELWGGWYATGPLASVTLANAVAAVDATGKQPTLSRPESTFEPAAYLAPTSDDVALLVLAHQTQMHNLITLTNYRTRIALHALARQAGTASDAPVAPAPAVPPSAEALPEDTRGQYERPAEQLLRYLLFARETPLPQLDAKQVIGASKFAREFAARGPRDSRGRSLRDFDLHTRLFRYPCSYLIYSDAFDALPEPSRAYVYHRLLQILSGQDRSPDFETLSDQDRRAILEILLETKRGLPQEWRTFARANHLRVADES
jgi:hypothetical protein